MPAWNATSASGSIASLADGCGVVSVVCVVAPPQPTHATVTASRKERSEGLTAGELIEARRDAATTNMPIDGATTTIDELPTS